MEIDAARRVRCRAHGRMDGWLVAELLSLINYALGLLYAMVRRWRWLKEPSATQLHQSANIEIPPTHHFIS